MKTNSLLQWRYCLVSFHIHHVFMKYLLVTVFMIMSLALFTNNSCLAQTHEDMEEELQEIGYMLGYAGVCLKEYNLADIEDPEGNAFAKVLVETFKPLGPGIQMTLAEAVQQGIFQYATDAGTHCKTALKRMIKIYKTAGLTGNHYKSMLDKIDKLQNKQR